MKERPKGRERPLSYISSVADACQTSAMTTTRGEDGGDGGGGGGGGAIGLNGRRQT